MKHFDKAELGISHEAVEQNGHSLEQVMPEHVASRDIMRAVGKQGEQIGDRLSTWQTAVLKHKGELLQQANQFAAEGLCTKSLIEQIQSLEKAFDRRSCEL